MKSFLVWVLAFLVAVVALFFITYVGVWNNLNSAYQAAQGGRSQYSSALNVCSEKIKGVWEIANQYMAHESKTFREVTLARNNYAAAAKAFENAAKEGKGTKDLTGFGSAAREAALNFQVQVEAYPQLKANETSQENMRNMEVATNEIKTALDDWIVAIRSYNTYRGQFWTSIFGNMMSKFPQGIEYYEGKAKELDIGLLNPQKK